MSHDYEQQRNDTLWAWHDLSSRGTMPEEIDLDIQFLPAADPQWSDVQMALAEAGYRISRYEDGCTLQASIGPIQNTPDEIWRHERACTEIALEYGFKPDGWGFLVQPG